MGPVGAGHGDPASPQLARLLAAVPRRTHRHPFQDTPVAQPEQHQLCQAAALEGAHLHLVRGWPTTRTPRRPSADLLLPP
jgi:hypothetical protein